MCTTTKVLALYLPQYHETEHNNEWWGKGFTDWVAVKNAESFFEGHNQPVVPLNYKYYNLLKKETMIHQAKLSKEYGLDGFIFYHYYFGDEKKELEKPAENLLEWKDIDMPFCFSWANQSWIRTWSKISGNVWSENYEKTSDKENAEGVLVKQEYGDKQEWKLHFEYLLPFFCDKRYIRINKKPVFIIFEPANFSRMKEMMKLWQELATENGLEGIFFIGNKTYTNEMEFDALMINEPGEGLKKLKDENKYRYIEGINCFEYEDYLKKTNQPECVAGVKTYYSLAVGYDTTLRRGKNGDCIVNRTPKLFYEYLKELLIKSYINENELLIINAWNEWGEGMYLEPDETDGYAYLEALRKAKTSVEKMSRNKMLTVDKEKEVIIEYKKNVLLNKYQAFSKIYSMWIDLLEEDKLIFKPILEAEGIGSVAIYGYFDMGKKLERQLKREEIVVKYAIDRSVASVSGGINVYHPDEEWPTVDCVIVTAYNQIEIKEDIKKKKKNTLFYTIQELLERRCEELG